MTSIRSRAAFVVSVLVFLLAAVPLVAFAASGDLDTTFDTDGKVTTDFPAGVARGVAVQSDGKIVAAGECLVAPTFGFCLARYNANGSLDTDFDGDGKVTTAIGVGASARAVAIQSDGKIVVAGSCAVVNEDFCLARYNSDGILDATFDTDGRVTTAFGTSADRAFAMAIQSDGRIVAAGQCFIGSSFDFCLARYNPDGSLDTSFGSGGKVTTAISPGIPPFATNVDSANAVAIQSDGKIVAAGRCDIPTTSEFCLARYTAGGSLDATFDGDGVVHTVIGSEGGRIQAVTIQGDGKIVAAGGCFEPTAFRFCLARYNSNGSLDTAFDTDGKVTTLIGGAGSASAAAIQSDGRIVAAGACNIGGFNDFCLARYGTDGTLDGSFSGDGTLTTAFGTSHDNANAVAIQSDGKIVAAGDCIIASAQIFCLARYLGDASILPTVSIDDVSLTEGNSGTSSFDFHVTLSAASAGTVTVHYATQNGTATAGSDYTAVADTVLTFAPSETSKVVSVSVMGDLTFEGDETFFVNLSSPTNATILDSQGVGSIANDDTASLASIIDAQPKLTAGQKAALKDKLDAVAAFYAAGKLGPACGKLNDFIDQVNGLTPARLDASTAAILVSGANALKVSYGCP